MGVAKSNATPDGLAMALAGLAEAGVFNIRLIPVGLAGVLLALFWNNSFTPTRLVLFLDFFPEDNGETNISPGPSGVSGICSYRTESGVPVEAGVEARDEGEVDLAGVRKRSTTPPKLVLPIDFLPAFCNNTK